MFNPEAIFQRAHAGREEIYQKKRGLTQSERLVLIMIDGVLSCATVKNKLPSLTQERFERALATLAKKELIVEVLMPLLGQTAEQVDEAVVDRFLRQDPTDPLTIIAFDPEDEFGIPEVAEKLEPARASELPTQANHPKPNRAATITVPSAVPAVPGNEPAMDAALIAQAELLAQEVRAARQLQAAPAGDFSFVSPTVPSPPAAPAPRERMHWGYWLIALGLSFIGCYLLARLRG